MAFKTSTSTVALFLFIAILGETMAHIMMRREAPDTTLSSSDGTDAASETEQNPSSPGVGEETDATRGEEMTEDEQGATDENKEDATDESKEETETAEEEGATEETKEEEEEKKGTTEEGIFDDDDDKTTDVGFQTGIVLGLPFVNLRQLQRFFFELERELHKVFENTLEEAAVNPEANNTSTTEEVTIGGHKYLVNRTVITGGDEDSTLVIRAISIVPAEERRKRAVMEMV